MHLHPKDSRSLKQLLKNRNIKIKKDYAHASERNAKASSKLGKTRLRQKKACTRLSRSFAYSVPAANVAQGHKEASDGMMQLHFPKVFALVLEAHRHHPLAVARRVPGNRGVRAITPHLIFEW